MRSLASYGVGEVATIVSTVAGILHILGGPALRFLRTSELVVGWLVRSWTLPLRSHTKTVAICTIASTVGPPSCFTLITVESPTLWILLGIEWYHYGILRHHHNKI